MFKYKVTIKAVLLSSKDREIIHSKVFTLDSDNVTFFLNDMIDKTFEDSFRLFPKIKVYDYISVKLEKIDD